MSCNKKLLREYSAQRREARVRCVSETKKRAQHAEGVVSIISSCRVQSPKSTGESEMCVRVGRQKEQNRRKELYLRSLLAQYRVQSP